MFASHFQLTAYSVSILCPRKRQTEEQYQTEKL